jgi:hypothetical protein
VGWPAAVLVTGLATLAGGLFTTLGATIAVVRIRSQAGGGACTFLFPAQTTLSLGSVCGAIVAGWLGWI